MGAPRRSEADRARTIGACWASAVEVGGEWVPNLHAASRASGVPVQTVMRWWTERDRTHDSTARDAAIRAREAAYEDGGRAWARRMMAMAQSRCEELLAQERMADADVDEAARALRNITETVLTIEQHLGGRDAGTGDGSVGAADLDQRVRLALRRIEP